MHRAGAYLVDLLDVGAAGVRAMPQNHLLQEHECALVVHMLPHLQRHTFGPTLSHGMTLQTCQLAGAGLLRKRSPAPPAG